MVTGSGWEGQEEEEDARREEIFSSGYGAALVQSISGEELNGTCVHPACTVKGCSAPPVALSPVSQLFQGAEEKPEPEQHAQTPSQTGNTGYTVLHSTQPDLFL